MLYHSKGTSMTIVGALLVSALIIGANAQPVDRPRWRVGDKWVYQQTADGSSTTEWSREVLAPTSDGGFTVSWDGRRQMSYDDRGNRLDPRGADFTAKYYVFPMEVGKTWTNDVKVAGDHWTGMENSTWTVKARETLTVPAGTFDCLRVEGVVWRNWTDTRQVAQSFNKANSEWTYWYCPEVQWFAKMRIRQQDGPWLPYVVRESVLLSYSRKQS